MLTLLANNRLVLQIRKCSVMAESYGIFLVHLLNVFATTVDSTVHINVQTCALLQGSEQTGLPVST